jgi:hypothetical protein
MIFKFIGVPNLFAIFATGKFAPNEVSMFPKKVPVGVGLGAKPPITIGKIKVIVQSGDGSLPVPA